MGPNAGTCYGFGAYLWVIWRVLVRNVVALDRGHGQDIGLGLAGGDGGALDGVAEPALQIAGAGRRIRMLPNLFQLQESSEPSTTAFRGTGTRPYFIASPETLVTSTVRREVTLPVPSRTAT